MLENFLKMNNQLVAYGTIMISYSIQTALFHVEFQSIRNGRKHHYTAEW